MTKSSSSAARVAELFRQMRNDIKFGAYNFGQWLKLIELQQRYGATQFEIRKVLVRLEAERLVEHKANAGYRVATPDPAERGQMRYVRMVLERSTAALIAARATEADIADLTRMAEAFEATIGLEGRQEQAAANMAFHNRLYAIAGNAVLSDLIRELRDRSHYGTTGRWRGPEGLRASGTEHFEMIEAIRRRDPLELERLIVRHIESF